jgi:hypothetical protein
MLFLGNMDILFLDYGFICVLENCNFSVTFNGVDGEIMVSFGG